MPSSSASRAYVLVESRLASERPVSLSRARWIQAELKGYACVEIIDARTGATLGFTQCPAHRLGRAFLSP